MVPGAGPEPPAEDVLPLGGVLAGLIDIPPGEVALLYGGKGIGKSTVALQAFRDFDFVTCEMPPEKVRAYATRIGASIRQISQARTVDVDGEQRLELGLSQDATAIVFDSITETGAPVETIDALRTHCADTGARCIAIAQVTRKGESRGGEAPLHKVDIVVRLDAVDGVKQLVVEKNRGGPEGTRVFELFEGGARLPKRRYYYSVEGSAPAYRLVPYPSDGAKYADFWKWAEAELGREDGAPVHLPKPPAASAARRSTLYRGGWMEPEDAQSRRDFALACGVDYFSPTD